MYAEIVISVSHKAVDRIFSYRIPDFLTPKAAFGMRAFVPFGKGNKSLEGYIVGFSDQIDFDEEKVKDITAIPDDYPLFNENMYLLAKWMQEKYFTTLADCLKCIIPFGLQIKREKLSTVKVRFAYINYENENIEEFLSTKKENAQTKVLRLLAENDCLSINDIKALLKISDSPIHTLIKNELITIEEIELKRDTVNKLRDEGHEDIVLNREQRDAIDSINNSTRAGNKKPFLIHGVTGSGKTEIYTRLIEAVVKDGKQAIVLVPEIALTPQTVSYFVNRFGDQVSVTHSRLTLSERFDQWKKAKDGDISIMIGPRSAIFAPFQNLGIIIIDEEHEKTYKSETSPKYHAKEVSIKLGELTGAQVVLGSATPSVESYYEALENKMELITIFERVNKTLPNVKIVDMRTELAYGNKSIFSRALIEALEANIKKNEQTILFLNRRGHSTFVSCRKCGQVMTCDNCNVNYTYHMYSDKLTCHYCGKKINSPANCPVCGSKYIKYFGVGTQRVEDDIKEIFPDIKVLRMDLDTTSRKHSHEKILTEFRNNEAQVLIGTQMVSKGLDFPNVTLVGVIAADLSLNNGDFRAAETTFQLITQVAGRAGRAHIEGNVFIQTYNPTHYSITYAKDNDYISFYNEEIVLRRQMLYPPFTHVFVVLFTSENEKKIITTLFKLLDIMNYYNRKALFETVGPAPCTVSKIKRKYRWKLIVKAVEEERLKNFVIYCMDKLVKAEDINDITVNLTINPSIIL